MTAARVAGDLSALVEQLRAAAADFALLEAELAEARDRRNELVAAAVDAGLTQRHVAELAGITQPTVLRITAAAADEEVSS